MPGWSIRFEKFKIESRDRPTRLNIFHDGAVNSRKESPTLQNLAFLLVRETYLFSTIPKYTYLFVYCWPMAEMCQSRITDWRNEMKSYRGLWLGLMLLLILGIFCVSSMAQGPADLSAANPDAAGSRLLLLTPRRLRRFPTVLRQARRLPTPAGMARFRSMAGSRPYMGP